jgi:excisionase family DNA binding protein
MPLSGKDTVLSTAEAINYLRISRPTYLKYIRQGRIKAVKAGSGWKVLLSELNRFLRGEENRKSRSDR